MRYFWKFLLLVFIALTTAQCGDAGGDGSSDIEVFLGPANPTVFLSDITISTTSGDQTVTAPWIAFRMKLQNLTDSQLNVLGISFSLSYIKGGGLQETSDVATFTPGDFLDSNGKARTDFIIQLPAGGSEEIAETFFIESLPDAEGDDADSFIFTITGSIEAYTGTNVFDEDTRNIRRKFTFTTQQPNF